MKPCLFCKQEPTRVWFDKDARQWCVTCPCDTFEMTGAQSEQEARFLWEHGDKDGWEKLFKKENQGTLF